MVCPILCSFISFCVIANCKLPAFFFFFLLYQVHPWFRGIDWDRIYHIDAAFIPEVTDELDTQNFEKFEEVLMYLFSSANVFHYYLLNSLLLSSCSQQSETRSQSASRSGPWRKVFTLVHHVGLRSTFFFLEIRNVVYFYI